MTTSNTTNTSSSTQLITRRELMGALKISASLLDAMNREGCPRYTFVRAVRYSLPEVLAWLRSRRQD